MKRIKVLSLTGLLASMVLASCGNPQPSSSVQSKEPSSEEPQPVSSETPEIPSGEPELSSEPVGPIVKKKQYNFILAAATLPPVLGALKSIESGDEIYAWIERGKTYAGIDQTSFHNLGFDPANNTNYGLTAAGFKVTIDKMKELHEADPDAFFNIYTTDYKVMAGVKIAIESGLSESDWHIYMASDGSATSVEYVKRFITGKTDKSSFEVYSTRLSEAEELISSAYASFAQDGEAVLESYANEFTSGYERCIPLASDSRFTLLSQVDLSKVTPEGWKLQSVLDGKHPVVLPAEQTVSFGFDSTMANVDYMTIDQHVSSLTETQKNEYLSLMFGSDRAEIERQFTRATLDDGETSVPEDKLVFIGGRIRQSSVGVIAETTIDLPADYADLSDEYVQVFQNAADYARFYSFLHNRANWKNLYRRKKASADAGTFVPTKIDAADLTDAQESAIILALTNYYLNYTWNIRFAYRVYGNDYDILFKGHPREDFTLVDNDSWVYVTAYEKSEEDDAYYCIDYKQVAHDLIADFYENDSEGKHVGLMPFGVAAENLVYVGGDVRFGGLLSSTYAGLSNDTPIVFLLANDESDATQYDQIASKYEEFGLVWNAGSEDETTLVYFNKANIAKYQYAYYSAVVMEYPGNASYASLCTRYQNSYESYIAGGKQVDSFGRIVDAE